MQAWFRRLPGGPRLYLYHSPTEPVRGAIVHVHAFAEEANKSRRQVAHTARLLAQSGFAVLQPDLLGCGDSAGDLADASWQRWLEDVLAAARWMRERHGNLPLWLWGHRAGALLAAEALPTLQADGVTAHLLLWQPVLQGRSVVQQLVRLKAAAAWNGTDGKTVIERTRAEFASGQTVEIAGYPVTASLVQALEVAVLLPCIVNDAGHCLVWLEVAGGETPALSPAVQLQCTRWRQAGWHTHAMAVAGAPFWQTVEIEEAPALSDATVTALLGATPTHPLVPSQPTPQAAERSPS